MKSKSHYIILLILLLSGNLFAQTGIIKGRVFNSINNESIPFANIVIDSTLQGTTSDMDGNYRIENLKPGSYNVLASFVGFKKAIYYEIRVNSTKPTILDISLIEESSELSEIEIKAAPFIKKEESPVSLRSISATEIYRNPGGNRDISKVIQILPGVASTVSFRNDIIIRGGAPNENRFYLDGIEVPNINHFATQGSSGGPVGMINVNFIREVDFYSGAFPANRGNALSSVIEFKQIRKFRHFIIHGYSPLGKKSTFIFSARRSYLQFLFKALGLPFLPTYNDFQYKQVYKIDNKNQITLIGLAAIDDFKLNTGVNDGITDIDVLDRNNYILGVLPVNSQWNYAIGANWTHFSDHSYQNLIFSRNHLNNQAIKYQDNIEQPNLLLLDYNSQEIENKFRFESTKRKNGWKWNIGVGFEDVLYTNSTFRKKELNGGITVIDFNSELRVSNFSAFTQLSKAFAKDKLSLSLGIRTDFNNYSDQMNDPVDQLSPRFSASYSINKKLNANFNIGRYYQLPAYTVLGYRDQTKNLVNKDNGVTYIRADHLVGGFDFNPTPYAKISIEGFYKKYNDYPFLLDDSISLANLGGEYGVIGNEAVSSSSDGKSYGLEILMQQKLSTTIYGIISYTWVRSKFQDKNGKYIPSAWDNQHILNIAAGKKLKRNWEAGMKFRLLGGAPYTPYNIELSSLKAVWDVTRTGILDWDRLNTLRNQVNHGLDIRVDKRWYFRKWALDAYLDIQNIYNFKSKGLGYLDVQRDVNGNLIENPNNPDAYLTKEIENTNGTILPSIGIMIEF
ncbi:MAG: ferric aerobactin receptor [Bacteroidetes bacterium HGW-Bacteroidetes-17]|nr:MAG: ferric aerobactin receptor [Bacteroidetes bacterium HGW-Bacteroidetes-17]